MTVLTWVATNLSTLALVAVTSVLAYFTWTLKKATDNLARIQILPKLVLSEEPHYGLGIHSGDFYIAYKNRGLASAFKADLFITTPQGVEFRVEPHGRTDVSSGETITFSFSGIAQGLRFQARLVFYDAEDNRYESKSDFMTSVPQKEAVN